MQERILTQDPTKVEKELEQLLYVHVGTLYASTICFAIVGLRELADLRQKNEKLEKKIKRMKIKTKGGRHGHRRSRSW